MRGQPIHLHRWLAASSSRRGCPRFRLLLIDPGMTFSVTRLTDALHRRFSLPRTERFRPPRAPEDVPAMDPVVQRVEASIRRPLGRPVQFVLEGANLVKGVVGPCGHAPVPPSPTNVDEAGALRSDGLCCPALHCYRMAPSDALPAQRDFPFDGYTRWLLPARSPGPGRASPVPVTTFRAFHVPYGGGFLGAALQVLRAFRGLRPDTPDSAPPCPFRVGLTPRQTSRRCCGPLGCSLREALDTGLRRQAFPPDAASLLPGSLAITWTGLAPVGGDELTGYALDQPTHLLSSRVPSGHAVGAQP